MKKAWMIFILTIQLTYLCGQNVNCDSVLAENKLLEKDLETLTRLSDSLTLANEDYIHSLTVDGMVYDVPTMLLDLGILTRLADSLQLVLAFIDEEKSKQKVMASGEYILFMVLNLKTDLSLSERLKAKTLVKSLGEISEVKYVILGNSESKERMNSSKEALTVQLGFESKTNYHSFLQNKTKITKWNDLKAYLSKKPMTHTYLLE